MRRPAKANAPLVRSLLAELARRGFDAAPRYLGRDEQGRETFSYLEGDVPDELDALSDETLVAAARLIRRFHDATAGSPLVEDAEVLNIAPGAREGRGAAARRNEPTSS